MIKVFIAFFEICSAAKVDVGYKRELRTLELFEKWPAEVLGHLKGANQTVAICSLFWFLK